jgi:transposase
VARLVLNSAHVAVAKYVDGLPLYRQEKKLARIGVHLPR